jgi:N-acetylglutamate synthase-like GNAT family acetyltransferase
MAGMPELSLKPLAPDHYDQVSAVIDDWWGGRPVLAALSRLFFIHFQSTSFAVEDNGRCVAFLAGFISQTDATLAYVHFVAVDPRYRKHGLGRRLHEHFASVVRAHGVRTVHAVTSPVNTQSLGFHQRLGFEIVPGNAVRDGISVHENHDGPGRDRVLMSRRL